MQYKMPTPKTDRNGTYYLRFNIPKALKPLTSKTCIKRSLGTRNKSQALPVASKVWAEVIDELESIRLSQLPDQRLTAFQIKSICAVWYEEQLTELKLDASEHEQWAFELIGFPFKNVPEAPKTYSVSFFWNELLEAKTDYLIDPDECINLTDHILLRANQEIRPELMRLALIRSITKGLRDPLINQHRLLIKPNGNTDTQLAQTLLFYFCKLKQYAWESLSEAPVSPLYHDEDIDQMRKAVSVLNNDAPSAMASQSGGLTFGKLVAVWEANLLRTITERKAEGRIKDYTPSFRKFIQFVGDINVRNVTSSQIREFRELLYDTPASQTKILRGMPLRKQVEYGKANGFPKLSSNTVRNNIVHISSLLEFAEREDYIQKNVARKLVPAKQAKPRRIEDQVYFTKEEIQTIFSQPIFTDFDLSQFKSRSTLPGEAFYWVPILSYYYGSRSSEMSERFSDNVFYSNKAGCHLLRIDESAGGSVKESASIRDLPIPQGLVDLGFIEFAESKTKGKPLFNNPKTGGMMKSDSYRKAFKAFLEGIPSFDLDGRQPTHCFRHTMETNLRELGVAKDISAYITGRARSSSSEEYGSYLKVVKDVLEQMPKLDLKPMFR
jgi:integrase